MTATDEGGTAPISVTTTDTTSAGEGEGRVGVSE